jgi:hypothetical protein
MIYINDSYLAFRPILNKLNDLSDVCTLALRWTG